MIRAVVAIVAAATVHASISSCGTGQFSLTGLQLTPDPPIVGQNVTMSVTFNNPGPAISAGTAKYAINYNGIPYSSTDDLCTQIACPIEIGERTEVSSNLWDGSLSGKITSQINWAATDGTLLACIQTVTRV
jgi:hypothetical protein